MTYTARYLLEHTISRDWGKTWETVTPRIDLEQLFTPEELPRVKVSQREESPDTMNGFQWRKAVIAEIERDDSEYRIARGAGGE